jgi:light-harvesting protein B-800-850 alpha chain
MNNAKLWLVVKPTVGVPLFLGAVAVGSFAVHLSVLRNTTWLSGFLSGQPAQSAMLLPGEDTRQANAVVLFNGATNVSTGGQDAVVVLPDGRIGQVTFTSPLPSSGTVAALK